MRRLFATIVGILAFLYTIDSSAQSVRDVFTICAGETVTFPVPTNGGGGPGACSPVLTDIRLEESATGISIDANGITLQPAFGIYTVVGRGSCSYLDPITGISSVFNAEVKWRYEVQPSTNCQEEERGDALFVDFPWLSDLVDRNNCTTEKIEVYISGIYTYLLVTEANGTAKLYNQDGQFYCQNADNFDCAVAYGFGPAIQPATWTCGVSNSMEDCLPEEQLIRSLRGVVGSVCSVVTKISKIEYNGATYYRNVIGRNPNVATPCGVQENFGKAINCKGQEVCLFALIAPPPNYDPEVCNAIQTGLGTETVLFPEQENICSAEETINELKTSSTASSCYAVTRINQVDYNGTSYFRTHVGRTIASFQPNVVSCGIRSDFGATFDCDGRKICDFAATIPPPDYDPATCDALVPVPDRIVWQDEENTCSIGDPQTLPFIATIINNTGEEVCERVKNITQIGYEGFTFFRLNSELVISTVNCVALAPTDIFLDCKGNTVGTIGGINNCPPGSACADLANASGNTIWTREDPPIDNSCSVEGRVFFENCDDGKLFFFIRTVDGRVFDPYLGDGVSFDFEEGQSVKFSYEAANFSSPCSIAEQAIILNCIEINGAGGTLDELFTRYEWLADLVDPSNCEGTIIFEYEQGAFNFISIRQGASLKLYFQDGTFYCENSATYDCISAYKLGAPINSWECTRGSDGCAYAELIRLNPCDPEVIETALYEYNGSTYIVTIPDPSLIDAGPVVRNCSDGSVFCTISFFATSGTCNDFFDIATKLEVLASRADCSTCSEIAVGGGLREIVISNQRTAGSPQEAIEIQSVQYTNKATRVGQSASLCSESICPIQPGETLTIPVEFERGNNEFEVRVTFRDGLTCLYDITLVEIEDCICAAVYLPVCGIDGNTYSNACRAACAGVAIASEGECGNNNPPMFTTYPWLLDIVDPNNCNIDGITVYQQGVYSYLLVADKEGGAILYNQDGQFYCQNSSNYDCVAAYNLTSNLTDFWLCNPTLNCPQVLVCGVDGNIYPTPCAAAEAGVEASPDLSPCQQNMNCNFNYEGFVTVSYCNGVPSEPILQLEDGRFIAAAFSGNANFTGQSGDRLLVRMEIDIPEGQEVNCQVPATIGLITCFEVIESLDQCVVTLSSRNCRRIGIYDESNNLLTTLDPSNVPAIMVPLETWQDPNPLVAGTTRTYIFKEGNFEVGRQTASCENTDIDVKINYPTGCSDAAGVHILTNTGCRDLNLFGTSGQLFDTAAPGEILRLGSNTIYILIAGSDTLGVEVAFGFMERDVDTGGCGGNNNRIFDEFQWLNDLVNVNNCTSEKVEVYQSGAYKYLLVTDANGTAILYNDRGQFYCQNSAGYDCVAAYNLGNSIATWTCQPLLGCPPVFAPVCGEDGITYSNECEAGRAGVGVAFPNRCEDGPLDQPCSVIITNGQCRVIDIYDESDNLLMTMQSAPSPIGPQPANLSIWEDPRPLFHNEVRRYVFKENNFVLGSQLVSCENPNISVTSNQNSACTDVLQTVEINNIGCREIEVHATDGRLLSTVSPEEPIVLDFGFQIYIFKVGTDTLRVLSQVDFTIRSLDLDSGGCGNNDAIFNDYPWLSDLIDPNNCTIGRVEIYQSGIYKYLRVDTGEGFAKLYNQDGLFYCQEASNFDCAAAYNLDNPIDTWTCDPNPPSEVCDLLTVINIAPCAPTIQEMAVYEYRGKQYLVTEPTTDTGIQDLEISALDCETGELFCAEGELLASNPDLLLCGLFLQEATKGFVVYNRERDCPDACPQEDCSLTTLPEEFGLFTIIYSVCKGDTLTVLNPSRSFLCSTPGGPAPPIGSPRPVDAIPQVLNFSPVWESRGAENTFSTSNSTISFFPKETTEFIGYWPNATCSGGAPPPNGRPVHYLVIVNEGGGCQTTASPTFLIEACVGEVVTIPSPVIPSENGATACPGNRQFIGGTTAELVEPIFSFKKDLQVRIQSEGSFQVEAMGGRGNYSTSNDVISCPELIYNFQVRLLDCPDFCAGVTPDPVCGVDGNTYSSACEAEQAGVAVAAQGECGGNCSNTGTIFFEHCDDGRLFYFLRTSDGRVYDPYFDTGITYEPVDGQQIRFDFVDAAFSSPCTNAEKAIILTCLEIIEDTNETSSEGTIGEEEFKKYPFLRNAISQNGCTTIEIYDQGSYDFVFLRTSSTSGNLYLDNGTFYCGSTPTYDCISAYGLSAPTTVFTCSNFDAPEREDRARQFKPEGLTVYPNPTIGKLTIQLPLTAADSYELYLHDLFGRTVHQEATAPDATSVNIDMSEYKDGVYYIELRASGWRGIQKVVKQGLD